LIRIENQKQNFLSGNQKSLGILDLLGREGRGADK